MIDGIGESLDSNDRRCLLMFSLDISSLILSELRDRLNMVAQDGMLCSGALREPLDVTGGRSTQLFLFLTFSLMLVQEIKRYSTLYAKCISFLISCPQKSRLKTLSRILKPMWSWVST